MAKINLAGIAIIVVGFLLVMYGAGKIANVFTIVPSFLYGATPSINSTGVYVTSGTTDTGWSTYYAVYGYTLDSATIGGQVANLAVPTHATGNGVFGLFQCRYQPSVYYIITGTGMAAPDTWKIFELNNPTSLVTINYRYVAKEAVVQDQLNNEVYDICGGGYDLNGQLTGAPITPFSGTTVHLSKDFGGGTQNLTCNNDGTCGAGETTANCPNDCVTVTPGDDTQNYGIAIIGLLLIGAGLWVVK